MGNFHPDRKIKGWVLGPRCRFPLSLGDIVTTDLIRRDGPDGSAHGGNRLYFSGHFTSFLLFLTLTLETINKGKDLHKIGKVGQQIAALQADAPPLPLNTSWQNKSRDLVTCWNLILIFFFYCNHIGTLQILFLFFFFHFKKYVRILFACLFIFRSPKSNRVLSALGQLHLKSLISLLAHPPTPCGLTPTTHILSVAAVIKSPSLSQHNLHPPAPLGHNKCEEVEDITICLRVNEKFSRHAEIKRVAVVC